MYFFLVVVPAPFFRFPPTATSFKFIPTTRGGRKAHLSTSCWNTHTPAPHERRTLPQHLQVVQLARLRARDEPGPVHRDAQQWAGRVEDAAALLEAQGRAVALRDRTRPRRVERAAVALALLKELQTICAGEEGHVLLRASYKSRRWHVGGAGCVCRPTCTPQFEALVVDAVGARNYGLAIRREVNGAHRTVVRVVLLGDQSQR